MTDSLEKIIKLIDWFNLEERLEFKKLFKVLIFIVEMLLLYVFLFIVIIEGEFFKLLKTESEIVNNITVLLIIMGIILVSMLLLFFKDLVCHKIGHVYLWDSKRGLRNWDFQGNILIDKNANAIHIVQSDLGCIIKNREWKNFTMSFEFKIPKNVKFSPPPKNNQLERGFGIIYRAKQLGKYYMLKVDSVGYQPHVRNVFWENNGKIANITLSQKDLDKWVQARLTLKENILTTEIGNDRFSYTIPPYSTACRGEKDDTTKVAGDSKSLYFKVPFFSTGSVGFRSAPFEEVFIRNLEVYSLHLRGLKNLIKKVESLREVKGGRKE